MSIGSSPVGGISLTVNGVLSIWYVVGWFEYHDSTATQEIRGLRYDAQLNFAPARQTALPDRE
jgi:hypothetical protein